MAPAHLLGVVVLEQPAAERRVHRQVGDHRLEVQVAVGDVQDEHAARRQHLEVEPEGLAGEESAPGSRPR